MLSRDQLLSQCQEIFREVLDSPDLALTYKTTAYEVEGWDSLNNMTLVMTIEQHFKVKFVASEVMGWRSVGEMLNSLQAKLNR